MLHLSDLIGEWKQEEIEKFVESFSNNGLNHDIEDFLKHKSIHFEKNDISRTTLLIKNNQIVGYFSIALKPLVIEEEAWNNINNTLKRHLMPGYNIKKIKPPVLPNAILIGQLGKNYNSSSIIEGERLLALAEARAYEARKYLGGRFIWLECEAQPKLMTFYEANGYRLLGKSQKSQIIFIKKI